MSQAGETFFTIVGCMDGRVQSARASFGQKKFGAEYPDTITDAGIAGLIANNPTRQLLESLKFKLMISIDKHHSKGVLVSGHQECAGNPVSDDTHIRNIKDSAKKIKKLISNKVPVVPIFVKRTAHGWQAEEV